MADEFDWSSSFASASTDAMRFYDEIMVPRLFVPWAELLLDKLTPESGEAVLDVACGPGTVTRLAARRVGSTGRVTGCDLSPAMLDLARSKGSPRGGALVQYRECPADALDVPDDDFDLATCQQGLQFFPNRPAAVAEMHRAVRPGGRVGVAVWCAIQECPPFAALGDALDLVLGTDVADGYRSGPWGFGDSDSLARLFEDGGFTEVEVSRHELPIEFEGGPGQLLLTLHAASVATVVAQLSPEDYVALATAVDNACRPITTDGTVRSQCASHVLTANVAA